MTRGDKQNSRQIQGINSVVLVGYSGEVIFSHCSCGENFYGMTVSVPRLSGVSDVLPLTVPETLCPQAIAPGSRILVEGQLRSYRRFDGERHRLVLSVFCKSVQLVFDGYLSSNSVNISCVLVKEPVIRRTPLGREICDLLVSVPRVYGKSDVIPVITWGAYATAAADLSVGQRVEIAGRFQSREYQKKLMDGSIEERTAYELSATEITVKND